MCSLKMLLAMIKSFSSVSGGNLINFSSSFIAGSKYSLLSNCIALNIIGFSPGYRVGNTG